MRHSPAVYTNNVKKKSCQKKTNNISARFDSCYVNASWAVVGSKRGNGELKQATFLSTRTAAGSKLCRYRWRMMASAVLV